MNPFRTHSNPFWGAATLPAAQERPTAYAAAPEQPCSSGIPRDRPSPGLARYYRRDAGTHASAPSPSGAGTSLQTGDAAAGGEGVFAYRRAPYPAQNAVRHWRGVRRREFEDVLCAMNLTRNQPMSGSAFLRFLSARCDEEWAQGRGILVNANEGIVEFRLGIDVPGGKEEVRVWRLVARSGTVFLRRVPRPDTAEALAKLKNEMIRSVTMRAVNIPNPDPVVNRASVRLLPGNARYQWMQHRDEFEDWRGKWLVACGIDRSGWQFLEHLSALCDEQCQAGLFRQIDSEGSVCEFEIEVEGVGKAKVWRLVDANGIVLRRAPVRRSGRSNEAGTRTDAEDALLKNMRSIAARRDSRKRKLEEAIGQNFIPIDRAHAHREWCRNGESFEPMRAAWNAAHGHKHGGEIFLQHLSALCDVPSTFGNARPVDEHGYIFQFNIEIQGYGPLDVWRLLDEKHRVYLRKTPTLSEHGGGVPAYLEAYVALQQEMLEQMKPSDTITDNFEHGFVKFDKAVADAQWRAPCMRQLEPYRQAWSAACGIRQSGGVFLQHVSGCCDQESLHGRGQPVDERGDIYSYRIRTHDGAEELEVWRMIHRDNAVLLRKAPAPPDNLNDPYEVARFDGARVKLITGMRVAAEFSRRALQPSCP